MSELITIRLRIVGVYFSQQVTINPEEVQTVKAVMNEYQRLNDDLNKPGGVRFSDAEYDEMPHKGVESLFRVIYNYPGKFTFPNGDVGNAGETLGGRVRKAGVLRLEEQMLPSTLEGVPVGTAWQYYVVGENGDVRSATKPNTGFQGYNAYPNQYFPFRKGDTIIWRLVVLTLPEIEDAPFAKAEIDM